MSFIDGSRFPPAVTTFPEFFFPVTFGDIGIVNIAGWSGAQLGITNVGIANVFFPDNFTTLDEAEAVFDADYTAFNANTTISTRMAACGEGDSTHTGTLNDITGWTANEIRCIDISGLFALATPGDYGAVGARQDDIAGNIFFLGVRMKFS